MTDDETRTPDEDDVEGHTVRGGALPDEPTEDDVEGHRIKLIRNRPPESSDDDVEGHIKRK